MNLPTPERPARPFEDVPCDACGGDEEKAKTCRECEGWGTATIRRCPYEVVEPDVWFAIELAGFAREGKWPVEAGTLGQTASCLQAFRMIWAREDTIEAELKNGG